MASNKKPTIKMKIDSDDEEDIEIIYKQKLIKNEILEKNLDKASFSNYCLGKKKDGDNLSNWSLRQLTEVVKEFSKEQDSAKKTKETEEGQFIQVFKTSLDALKLNMKQSKQQSFGFSDPLPIGSSKITCLKLEKTQLNDVDVKVKIDNPKIEITNLLSLYQANYDVTTQPLKWKVIRKYTDFELLREILVKLYPRDYIPIISTKPMGPKQFCQEGIEKRMKYLQQFMDYLMSTEAFKACPALVEFLSISDKLAFSNKMKEMNDIVIPTTLEETKNFSGCIETSYDNENEFKTIEEFFSMGEVLHKRLNKNLKKFTSNMSEACKDLENITKDFNDLLNLNKTAQMSQEVTDSYKELGSFFRNWQGLLDKQNDIINSDLRDFFKNIKLESSSFNELIKRRNEIKERYTKENAKKEIKEKDKKKPSVTVDSKDKPELSETTETTDRSLETPTKKGILKESETVQALFDKLGYSNQGIKEEVIKMMQKNKKLYINKMKDFSSDLAPIVNSYLEIWTNLVSSLDDYHF